MSWARTLPEMRASGPAIEMHSTSHLEIEALDTALKGSMDVTNKEVEDLLDLVRSKYHFKAMTGHHTLSSSTEEKDEIEGKKISTDWEVGDWFLAMKSAPGTRRRPLGSQRIWPGSIERAWRVLTLWPEAMATRHAALIERKWREALWRGSNGALERALRTEGRLQAGSKDFTGGRFRKKDLHSLERTDDTETEEPSWKALWQEAIAER